jgi:hypothetical protein
MARRGRLSDLWRVSLQRRSGGDVTIGNMTDSGM